MSDKKKRNFLQALSAKLNETFLGDVAHQTARRTHEAVPTQTLGQTVTDAQRTVTPTAPTRSTGRILTEIASRKLVKNIARTSAVAGAAGAVVGATGEAYKSYERFKGGELTGAEYFGRVSVSAAQNAVGVGGRTAAAAVVQEGAKAVVKRVGGETIKRLVGSNVGTAVAFGVVEQGIDTVHLVRGTIDKHEYGARSAQTVVSTGGALGGAMAGAAVGSVVPVFGTAIGAVVGGVLGGIGGSIGGRRLGEHLFRAPKDGDGKGSFRN